MFIQFFHDQILQLYQLRYRYGAWSAMSTMMSDALRMSVYVSPDPLYIPTIDVVQSPVIAPLLADLNFLADQGIVHFVGSAIDIGELQAIKIVQFDNTSLHDEWWSRAGLKRLRGIQFAMQVRETNTTADLKRRYAHDIASLDSDSAASATFANRQLRNAYYALPDRPSPAVYEDALRVIPDRLENHAFLWNVIEDLGICNFATSPAARRSLEFALAWNWSVSHVAEYGTQMAGRIKGIGYLDCGLRHTHNWSLVDLTAYFRAFEALGIADAFSSLSLRQIVELRSHFESRAMQNTLLRRLHDAYSPFSRPDWRKSRSLAEACDQVRSAVLGAHSPNDALIAAASRATLLDGDSGRSTIASGYYREVAHQEHSATTHRAVSHDKGVDAERGRDGGKYDRDATPSAIHRRREEISGIVLVAYALTEELEIALCDMRDSFGPEVVYSDSSTGRLSYSFFVRTSYGQVLELVFVLVGRGEERAAAVTAAVIEKLRPQIVANLGIAGALSGDLELADVVVADQIVSYLANAKASDGAPGSFRFQLGGDASRSDEYLVHRAVQLPLVVPNAVEEVRQHLTGHITDEVSRNVGNLRFAIVAGPMASGTIVSASSAFTSWIRGYKRDYLAIDMESSGAAVAASSAQMINSTRFIAMRGISDLADQGKAAFERSTKGGVRKLAVLSSLGYFLVLLRSLPPESFPRR